MDRRDELRTLLTVDGVTTAKVGEKLGITGQAISAMSVGKSRVSEEAIRAARLVVCEALGGGLHTLETCLSGGAFGVETDGRSEEETHAQ